MSQENDLTKTYLCKKDDHLPRHFTKQQLNAIDSNSDGYSWDGWTIVDEPQTPPEISDQVAKRNAQQKTAQLVDKLSEVLEEVSPTKPVSTSQEVTEGDTGNEPESDEQAANQILGIPAEDFTPKTEDKKEPAETESKPARQKKATKQNTDNEPAGDKQESGERDDIGSEREEQQNPV